MQIPKNVMQIGEIDPHTKVYMEDYVHTFLEQAKKAETFLVFGRKDEKANIRYYQIYGVERKNDWDRGSYPYFKKYERLGAIEGGPGHRVFKPVRGSQIALDGYFIFYEQNEDMQSYMIAVKEKESIPGSEEKEEVIEAVRMRREQRQKEAQPSKQEPQEPPAERESPGREVKLWGLRKAEGRQGRSQPSQNAVVPVGVGKMTARQNASTGMGGKVQKPEKGRKLRIKRRKRPEAAPKKNWTIPEICSAGSLVMLMLLIVLGLTSVNRYPDMAAVAKMFSGAVSAFREKRLGAGDSGQEERTDSFIIEGTFAQVNTGEVAEAIPDEPMGQQEDILLAREEDGGINWTIGMAAQQEETQTEQETGLLQEEGQETALQQTTPRETQPDAALQETAVQTEEESAQAIAHPTSYIVKKGDSLLEISRRFYGTPYMVTEICEINEIKNPNHIQPGQNILLP